MYIYIDILIITNIYVDFLLLKTSAVITHSPLKTKRGILAAFSGSLSSLVILLPEMSVVFSLLVKVTFSFIVVFAAFGAKDRSYYLKRVFVFWLVSFLFSGVCIAVSELCDNSFIVSRNGAVYADFSMSMLIISTITAYICVCVYKFFADCSESGGIYTVVLSENGRTASFKAAADTGNILKDSFTGKQVMVVSKYDLSGMYDSIPSDPICAVKSERWRFIPYTTASGSGLIPIIHPESIYIKDEESGRISCPDVYVGVSEQHMEFAVFHPKILF